MNVYPLKCRIRNAGEGVTRVDVFDDIGEGGWFTEGLTAKAFTAQLSGVKGPLSVHVNSVGGDVWDGLAISSAIRDHKGPTTVTVDGIAASIASVIVQGGGERVMSPGSMLMIHDAFGGAVGNAAEMTKMAETLDKVSANLADIYASRSGRGSTSGWRDQMKAETWYTAEEAVAAGLADRVGEGKAALPAGLDLGALGTVPGRIAAALRTLPAATVPQPQDAARHDPMKGSHSHPHPAYGSQGGDSMHSHDHSHDGDASHSHSHASSEPDGGDGAQDHAHGPEGHAPEPQVVQLQWNGGDGETLAQALLALLRENATVLGLHGAAGKPGTHGDHERFDPDGDGDCDACPEGDTDHDYWSASGEQLKSVPGKPMPAGDALTEERVQAIIRKALTDDDVRAIIREGFRAASDGVDSSDWDASRAWKAGAASDDPAAFYGAICAGEKAGDKATQAAWALPYKYTPSSPPNAAGVKAALGRLPQTEGLTNAAEAKSKLQGLMKKINPDYEPEDHAGDLPAGQEEDDLSGIDLEQIRSALRGAFA